MLRKAEKNRKEIKLLDDQRRWISKRDKSCADINVDDWSYQKTRQLADCISDKTQERMAELMFKYPIYIVDYAAARKLFKTLTF